MRLLPLFVFSVLVLPAAPGAASAAVQRGAAEGALAPAQAGDERLPLWPGAVPGERHAPGTAREVERSHDPAKPDRYVERIDAPWLAVYPPRPGRGNGRALLVIPGGGYQRVVIDKEGTELVPEWVDRAGYTLFVLRYRLPEPARDRDAALADAQRAMRVIRHHAVSRGVDPQQVAVMGFSAGGHVAARLATAFDHPAYPPGDAVDRLSARPSHAVLVYPVIDMGASAHPGSRQRLLGQAPAAQDVARYSMQQQVRADMPPVMLLHAADDTVVRADNSLLMAQALARAGVDHELHVFARGGHGFGMRTDPGSTTALWPALVQRWLLPPADKDMP